MSHLSLYLERWLFIDLPWGEMGKKSCEEKRTEDRNWFYILQGQFQFAQINFKAMNTFSIMFFAHSILSNTLCQSIVFSQYYNSLYFLILFKKCIRNHYLMHWTIPAEAWQNNIWAVIQLPDSFKRFCHTWAETFSMPYQVCSFTSECSQKFSFCLLPKPQRANLQTFMMACQMTAWQVDKLPAHTADHKYPHR